MRSPENDEGRPLAGPASNVIDHDNITETQSTAGEDIPRCTRCRRPLVRDESIEAGMGWRCIQHEREQGAA